MSQPDSGPPWILPPGGGPPTWATTLPPRHPLGPGDPAEIGPYRLEAVLGAGGMGRVYLGRTPAGSAVAVKVVHREYAGDRAFRERFRQEVAAARRVQGLYTVPVVDADLGAAEPWLATAYVPGPSLQDAVADGGPLPADAALGLLARVAEALQSIHAAGVVHRDLKPSNIVLTAEGPKVIDFGIARAADVTSVTRTGVLVGTPAYMAPEYLRGETATEAVDVFALGGVALFAATGSPAFGGGSHHGVTYRILEQAPDLDGCPEPVRSVAARCLEKDPRQRPTPAEVVRYCHRGGGPRTAPSPPAATGGTVPATAPDFHAAVTAPARSPAGEDHRAGAQPVPPGSDPVIGGAPPMPVLLGTFGVLALVVLLVVALVPGGGDDGVPASVEPATTLTDFPEGAGDVAFSPDGKTLATGGGDGRVRLWDVQKWKPRHTLIQRDASGGPTGVSCLAFSSDGSRLATCADSGGVGLWDVAERRQIARFASGDMLTSVAFSPDGSLVATTGEDGVQLWDAASGVSQDEALAVLQEAGAEQAVFSPDGTTLATAGSGAGGRAAHLWDVSERTRRATLMHDEGVRHVAFSPDGTLLATSTWDNVVRLWETAEGRAKGELVEDEAASLHGGLAFGPDGATLAVGNGTGVGLWDMADRERRTDLVADDVDFGAENVYSVAFNGRIVVASAFDSTVRVWKTP